MSETSSNEVYGQTCQICEDSEEKEAVGWCTSCDMYMCRTCCNQHKKIRVTKQHEVVGKEQFGVLKSVKGFFERRLMPSHKTYYPQKLKKLSFQEPYNLSEMWSALYKANSSNKKEDDILYIIYQADLYKTSEFKYEIAIVHEETGYAALCSSRGTYECKKNCNPDDYTYITKPFTNTITKYCRTHNSELPAFEFPAGNDCYGIAPFNKGLAIAVNIEMGFDFPSWHIKHVETNGNLIKEFCYDSSGKPMFQKPVNLASNQAHDILFIADQCGSIIALDTTGSVLYKYKLPTNTIPHGITCDTDDNVIIAICDYNTYGAYKVIQIDKHGQRSRDLLKATVNAQPKIVCFSRETQMLAVADSSRQITYFKFLP